MTVTLAAADGGAQVDGIDTTADPLRFDEAFEWFQKRVPITKDRWLALEESARRRAFTAAGVTALDVLDQVWRAVDKAIDEGTSYEDFRRGVTESLDEQWGRSNPSRVETIFRTNIQTAYAAGRYRQMRDPDVLASRPWWQYMSILDAHTTPICRPLEGITKHADDPFWNSHYPPLHFNCRSTVITLTHEQAANEPFHPAVIEEMPQDGFGMAPSLSEWQPRAEDYPAELWHAFQAWQASRAPTPPSVTPTQGEAPAELAPTKRSPAGVPVSQALKITARGNVASSVRAALEAIDDVHGDGALPTLPVDSIRKKYTNGVYTRTRSGIPVGISISQLGDHAALTMAHETGHFLDNKAIGDPNNWASANDPRLEAWRKAIGGSRAVTQLRSAAMARQVWVEQANGTRTQIANSRKFCEYLLTTHELFARSYAQWIAVRSGSARMLEDLQIVRRRPGEAVLPTQWDDDDFEPIARALDDLMIELGWVRR